MPYLAFTITLLFPFLSFQSLSSTTSTALGWLISLITAGALIDFLVICITYIQFHKKCKVQGLDRKTLPYYGYFQPYCAYIGAVTMVVVCLFCGYSAFDPWSVQAFFRNYTMQIAMRILFVGWKLWKKTKWLKPAEIDLVWEMPVVDAYEATFTNKPLGFWTEMGQLIGLRRYLKDVKVRDILPDNKTRDESRIWDALQIWI